MMKKQSYYTNERADAFYSNGEHAMIGDKVTHCIGDSVKEGTVINVDKSGVSIKYNDGTGLDNINPNKLTKIAMRHLSVILKEFSIQALSS